MTGSERCFAREIDLIAAYPDCAVEYGLVRYTLPYVGLASHRRALDAVCRKLFSGSGDDPAWTFDVVKANAAPIGADRLFAPANMDSPICYRKAFLYPPHGNRYTAEDFDRVNAVLFPNGADGLEVFTWTTDWSDYFDDGHEWWGALCLTVYDKCLDRFVVILASATD